MARLALLVAIALFLLPGCKSWSPNEDSSAYQRSYSLTPDGYYRVRKGDTLHAIAFNFGLDWRDIAAWNQIRSPYVIYPDQDLKLSGPQRSASRSATPKPAPSADRSSTPSSKAPASGSAGTSTAKSPPPVKSTSKTYSSANPGSWRWPTEGRLISTYKANDPARNGIEIGGKEGQAVKATAGGEVVYSGNGLIGYGELIIIKHSETMLSAYAHNRKRLVKEGQKVRAGEKIAEMGRNDRNQAILHFEIRSNGTPRDPLNYLPAR